MLLPIMRQVLYIKTGPGACHGHRCIHSLLVVDASHIFITSGVLLYSPPKLPVILCKFIVSPELVFQEHCKSADDQDRRFLLMFCARRCVLGGRP